MAIFQPSEDKEQKLNELQLRIQKEKQKANKELNRQKILLGAFFGDMLTKKNIGDHVQYTIDNLENYFTTKSDKKVAETIVNNIKQARKEKQNTTAQPQQPQGNNNG